MIIIIIEAIGFVKWYDIVIFLTCNPGKELTREMDTEDR